MSDDRSDDPGANEPDEPLAEKYEPLVEKYGRYEKKFQPDEDEFAPDPPELPDPDEIPADLQRTFWSTVAAANVGLLAASLGVMLVGFRGQWREGGALIVLGVAALGWTYYKYRAFRNRKGGDADGGNESDEETDPADRKG